MTGPVEPPRLTEAQTEAWRRRQRERSWWTAGLLLALVVLVFFIAVRKMTVG